MPGPYSGNDGAILIGANPVTRILSYSYTEEANERDETAIGDTVDQRRPGTIRISGQITCLFDDADTNGQETLAVGANVTLLLRPGGTGTGLPEESIPADIMSVGAEVPGPNDTVRRSFSFSGRSRTRSSQT